MRMTRSVAIRHIAVMQRFCACVTLPTTQARSEATCWTVSTSAYRAVINRYGFNNDGLDAVAERLAAFRQRVAAEPWRCPGLVAVNLGAPTCAPATGNAVLWFLGFPLSDCSCLRAIIEKSLARLAAQICLRSPDNVPAGNIVLRSSVLQPPVNP